MVYPHWGREREEKKRKKGQGKKEGGRQRERGPRAPRAGGRRPKRKRERERGTEKRRKTNCIRSQQQKRTMAGKRRARLHAIEEPNGKGDREKGKGKTRTMKEEGE